MNNDTRDKAKKIRFHACKPRQTLAVSHSITVCAIYISCEHGNLRTQKERVPSFRQIMQTAYYLCFCKCTLFDVLHNMTAFRLRFNTFAKFDLMLIDFHTLSSKTEWAAQCEIGINDTTLFCHFGLFSRCKMPHSTNKFIKARQISHAAMLAGSHKHLTFQHYCSISNSLFKQPCLTSWDNIWRRFSWSYMGF